MTETEAQESIIQQERDAIEACVRGEHTYVYADGREAGYCEEGC